MIKAMEALRCGVEEEASKLEEASRQAGLRISEFTSDMGKRVSELAACMEECKRLGQSRTRADGVDED